MSKGKKSIEIEVVGGNCTDVTGSCTLIHFEGRTVAFEMGMIQGESCILDNYRANSRMLQRVKPKQIDMIITGHPMHLDHGGHIVSVVKNNKNIRVITPEKTGKILKRMWLDCANINERDCESISDEHRIFEPFYKSEDVMSVLNNVEEFGFGEIHKLDENISIRYTHSGYIINASQCEVFITIKNRVTKIFFTSDLGNIITQDKKYFVHKFEPVTSHSAVSFCESTYGLKDVSKIVKPKDLKKDLEKLESVIEQFAVSAHSRVFIPCFSLDRTPYVLSLIYDIYGKDNSFKVPVIIDSPLSNGLIDDYFDILEDDQLEKFKEIMSWKNIVRITHPEDSKNAVKTYKNAIIISSSGMLTAGRSVKWCQSILPDENSCILSMGYSAPNTLLYKIKNNPESSEIMINGKPCKNKATIVNFKSFSSHMMRDDLIKYYSSLNTDRIYLIHGSEQAKIDLKEDLVKEISKKYKTTKVICTNIDTKIHL